MSSKAHKKNAPRAVKTGIITVSTTRSLKDDKSGLWISKRAKKEGHEVVFHQVITDEIEIITRTVMDVIRDLSPQALLVTGGTLTSFGPIFAQLSFEQIDSAAILSRATAGVIEKTILFCMPGSINACKLACKAIIFPELGHIAHHIHE